MRQATVAYIAYLDDPGLQAALAVPAHSMDEMIDRFEEQMRERRREVVRAMRRDLGTD